MAEKGVYPFIIRCRNCGYNESVTIPVGVRVVNFTAECKDECPRCGICNWEGKGQKELTLSRLIGDTLVLARKVRGFPDSKKIDMRFFLRNSDVIKVYKWSSWEEEYTKEKLIFLESDNKCVVTDFRNVEKIEYLYGESETKPLGFEPSPVRWPRTSEEETKSN